MSTKQIAESISQANIEVNEHGQITDMKVLAKQRYKFGFVNTLFQGEEIGLLPVYTVIARSLGGNAFHIGICGAFSNIHSLVHWVGAILLRRYNSNQKAMTVGLWAGAVCALIVCASILLAFNPAFKTVSLWAYLVFGLVLALISGVLWNIETSWIGDLVPKQVLGWFSSVKWMIAAFGLLCCTMLFGKVADISPTLPTYAGLFLAVAVSHVVGVLLVSTIVDRKPKSANFIFGGESKHERLNYKSLPLWCYTAFYTLWASGRTALLAFSTAYLLDQFHYNMTTIASIFAIQSVVILIMLFFLGKISDKFGNRIPLLLISGFVSCGMFLWVASAWWGVVPIIVYQFINGAAGQTHSMLSTNYGLEIFPDKGRAGYFGFIRVIVGIISVASVILAGVVVRNMEGMHFSFLGTMINHYHLFFAGCSLITLCSIIPLIIAGKHVVKAV